MDCTLYVAKTKALINFAVPTKLICVFVFSYAKCCFSRDAAHFILTCDRYTNQRRILFRHLRNAFNLLDSNEKFKYLITQEYRHVAKYITQSFLYQR